MKSVTSYLRQLRRSHSMFLVLIITLAFLTSGCSTLSSRNKAVTSALAGQVVDAAALVRCADIVAKHPDQALPLTAMLDQAQKQIDSGSPFTALLTIANRNLSPDVQAELAIVTLLLQQKMQSFMAAAQGAVNGCRMGILSQQTSSK